MAAVFLLRILPAAPADFRLNQNYDVNQTEHLSNRMSAFFIKFVKKVVQNATKRGRNCGIIIAKIFRVKYMYFYVVKFFYKEWI